MAYHKPNHEKHGDPYRTDYEVERNANQELKIAMVGLALVCITLLRLAAGG